jgi:hypothetical protein
MSQSQITPEMEAFAEELQAQRLHEINDTPEPERAGLEKKYGRVWTPSELADDFEVRSFSAPFVIVTRKADGQVGSLEFQHAPRFYFNFMEHVNDE